MKILLSALLFSSLCFAQGTTSVWVELGNGSFVRLPNSHMSGDSVIISVTGSVDTSAGKYGTQTMDNLRLLTTTFSNTVGLDSTAWNTDVTRGTKLVADSTGWNTALSQTQQWSGGSTNLVAATGRTSLGLNSMALVDSASYSGMERFDTTAFATTGLRVALLVKGMTTAGGAIAQPRVLNTNPLAADCQLATWCRTDSVIVFRVSSGTSALKITVFSRNTHP